MSITSGRRVFVHEKVGKLLGKKRNGVPGSHKQQMSTIIFYMIILLGPSALVSNADMSRRWFSHLHFPTCCFLSLDIGSHQSFHPLKDFLSEVLPEFWRHWEIAHFPEVYVGKSIFVCLFLTVNFAIYSGGSSILFHLCSDQSPRIGIYGQNGLKLNWKTNFFFFYPSTGLSNESERLNLGNSFSKILCDYTETLKPCRKMCILVHCGKIL